MAHDDDEPLFINPNLAAPQFGWRFVAVVEIFALAAAELLDRSRAGFERRGAVDEQVPELALQKEGASFERAAELLT